MKKRLFILIIVFSAIVILFSGYYILKVEGFWKQVLGFFILLNAVSLAIYSFKQAFKTDKKDARQSE